MKKETKLVTALLDKDEYDSLIRMKVYSKMSLRKMIVKCCKMLEKKKKEDEALPLA
jgi:hypothetical protein